MPEQTLLTIPDVAERLQMTPDGVYKLIQRGKLESVRLSERKLRVTEAALQRFNDRQNARVDEYLRQQRVGDPDELRAEFVRRTGSTPEEWLAAWKRDEFDDTPENMALLVHAAALRSAANNVPLSGPAVDPRATAALTGRRGN